MEKFLYLFRGGNTHAYEAKESKAAQDNMQAWIKWMDSLQQKGALVGGEALMPNGKQVNGTKKIVTDGPFVEAKEMIGGYVIVNAKDINDAVEMSVDCPIFKENGKVEVRPIQNLDM